MNDIIEFLPKYPNIDQEKEAIFNPYDTDFYESIYRKKEFYDEKLEPTEEFSDKLGMLLKHQKIISRFFSQHTPYNHLLLVHEMGCVAPETPILLWNGTIKRADDITADDILIGDDGTPRTVISLIKGESEMFEIYQTYGDKYIVNSKHILTLKIVENFTLLWNEHSNSWTLRWFDKILLKSMVKTQVCHDMTHREGYQLLSLFRNSVYYQDNTIDITVTDYIGLSIKDKEYLKGFKCSAVEWQHQDIELDPYTLGMWLGYGGGYIPNAYDAMEIWKIDINWIGLKCIPQEYIINDTNVRLALLSGFIDKSHYVCNDSYIEVSVHNNAEQIMYIAKSLGINCVYIGTVLYMSGNVLSQFNLKGYAYTPVKHSLISDISVQSIGIGPYNGWELDASSNKRFLLGDFTVTHNTGKSCAAIGAIEQMKNAGGYRGALYLNKGDDKIAVFKKELIEKCTDGRYIPPEGEVKLTALEQIHRRNKAVGSFYQFNTFETFAKKIRDIPNDDILRAKYSNYIIVIDEIHNIRMKSKTDGLNVYTQFYRFLHVVKDSKILLLSGTPMKDTVDEIASVMNLILPISDQLPTGKKFITDFFTKDLTKDVYRLIPKKIPHLKRAFKGRVSYLRSMQSNVTKVFIGRHMGTLKYLKVVPEIMSKFQSGIYQTAYNSDKSKSTSTTTIEDIALRQGGIYSKSRQASLFVFPDKSVGSEGFKKYITKTRKTSIIRGERLASFSMNQELKRELSGSTQEEKLDKLRKYSSIYAASIETILDAQNHGKCIFIYNEWVEGSGLILFGLILELFGFKKASGNENPDSHAPRYASLTGETTSTKEITLLVERFNSPDNIHGKIINIIIGSRKISEGYSFKNIQVEDIQTPWYNYSEISQAIARGYRLGSHNDLISSGVTNPEVEIYQRVAVPDHVLDQPAPSGIDLYMYEISENKDISIKGVERVIKESSFDCALTYNRNLVSGKDGKRDCEYMDCNYKCDGIGSMQVRDLDVTTYQLYYALQQVDNIIANLTNMFGSVFVIDFDSISSTIRGGNFVLLTALYKMINENIPVINKYGFVSYLKESNNIYFLVDSLSVKGDTYYYTKFPHVKKTTTFNKLLDPLYDASLTDIVKLICSRINISKNMLRLPITIQALFLESSLLAQKRGITTEILLRGDILQIFNTKYEVKDDVIVSTLLPDQPRCLEDKSLVWKDCPTEYSEKISQENTESKYRILNNPYKIAGQFSSEPIDDAKFCIFDRRGQESDKINKQTKGQQCSSWTINKLSWLIINTIKLPLPDKKTQRSAFEAIQTRSKKKQNPINIIGNMDNIDELDKIIKKLNNTSLIDSTQEKTVDYMLRIIYYGNMKNIPLCKIIQDFLVKEGLTYIEPKCGKK